MFTVQAAIPSSVQLYVPPSNLKLTLETIQIKYCYALYKVMDMTVITTNSISEFETRFNIKFE